MTSTNALPMPVAEALANGAPRNLGALAATATARGWGAKVERDGDAWTLVIASPADSRTGRYTWRAGKWAAAVGYRVTVGWYRSDPDAMPGTAVVEPVDVAPVVEEVAPSTNAEAAALATLHDASDKITKAVAEARDAVQEAQGCHAEAETAGEAAEAASTTREAEDWAEEAEDAAGRAPECVKRAKSALRRVQAQRRAIQAAARAVEELGLDEGYRRTAVEAEDTARELLGDAEEAAEEAQNWAEAARETAERVCPMCQCFMRRTPCGTHPGRECGACAIGQCGCRALMLATLDRAGSTVARTVDAEAVRVGYLLDSDDAARVEAGQLMLAGDWTAEDMLAEADGPAEAVTETVETAPETAPQRAAECAETAEERPSDDAGWENGRTRERARVLEGWATVAEAEDYVTRFPQCIEVRERFERYEGEWRRSALLSTVHAAGVEFGARLDFNGAGWTVSLPTGDVSGRWGDVARAVRAYVIATHPAHVVAFGEIYERQARIDARREAEYAAAEAEGMRALDAVRTDAARAAAATRALRTVDVFMPDDALEAVESAAADAARNAAECERVWRGATAYWWEMLGKYAARVRNAAAWLIEGAAAVGVDVPDVAPVVSAAADASPSDPGAVDGWESDGGACVGVESPRGPECGPAAAEDVPTPDPRGSKGAALPQELDEDTTKARHTPAGEGAFSRELDAYASRRGGGSEGKGAAAPVAAGLRVVRRGDMVREAEAAADAAEAAAGVLAELWAEAARVADCAPLGDVRTVAAAEAAEVRWYRMDWRARDARRAAELLREEDGRNRAAVERARMAAARLLSGEVPAGRGAWLSADGGAAVTFPLAWESDDNPAAEKDGAFVALLADAVAARDGGRTLKATDVPSKVKTGRGPGAEFRAAVATSGRPLVEPWKAPRIPAEGKPLSAETLGAWDMAGDVISETEAAPGVWLPMAAVQLAETACCNGWTVAVQRENGGRTVTVRAAGTAERRGEPVAYELSAVWVDGAWCEGRSGVWVNGERYRGGAPLWRPKERGRQAPSILGTLAHAAEAGTLAPAIPPAGTPSAPAPVGVSDPGTAEAWEAEGGAVPGVVAPRPVAKSQELDAVTSGSDVPAAPRALALPGDVAEAEAADIVIRHTHEDGTTVEGSEKGDGVWETLRPLGWTYRRNPGIFIRGSRYKGADRWKLNRAADAVRALGLSCAVVVEEEMSFAEREAARVGAAEERAERYADRSGRAAASSQAARDASDRISERFWMGQPILVDHHSEGRARRDQERMHNAMRKSIAEGERAGYWASRAAAADAYERYRKAPGRTLRRIEKLEAERRGVLRERDGVDDRGRFADVWRRGPSEERREELTRRLAEYDEELTYWAETIKEAERRGFKVWSRADFVRGDFVRWRGTWYEVTRVNAKTTTVPHIHAAFDGGAVGSVDGCRVVTRAATTETRHKGSTYTLPYNEASGRMSAEQMRAALAGEAIPADPRDVTPEAAEAERAAEHQEQAATVPVAPASAPAPVGVSDPGTAEAWEGDGGAVPGVVAPRPVAKSQELDADTSKGDTPPGGEGGVSAELDAYPPGGPGCCPACGCREVRGGRCDGCGWTPAPAATVDEEKHQAAGEGVTPLVVVAVQAAMAECQTTAELLTAYAEEHPLDEAAEGWAFEAVERVAMCAWAVEEGDEERADEYARAAKGERAALVLGRLDEAGPMTPERLAALDADTLALLRWYAGPWPVRWLWPPEADTPRVINLFHGPGGWSVGIRDVLGANVDMVGVDLDPGAVATAEAAGFEMIHASVTDLDPESPALQWVTGVILSPPCQAYSPAGLRMGRYASAIELIVSVVRCVGAAAGFLALVDEDGNDAGTAPRAGETWDEVRAPLAALDDVRAGLMAEVVVWPLAMLTRGGSVEWVAVEQSSALPSEIERALLDEFVQAGWGTVEAETLDAVDYGAASHRRRRFMTAYRTAAPFVSVRPSAPLPRTTFAECVAWERGRTVATRGKRGINPETGRAKGGGNFSADKPSTCITATAYGWADAETGEKIQQAQIGRLVGFRGEYPWRHVGRGEGIRNRAQQAADAVCPMVAAAVIGRALDVEEWETRARAYAHELYGTGTPAAVPVAPAAGASVPRPRRAPVAEPVRAMLGAAPTTATAAGAGTGARRNRPRPAGAAAPVRGPLSRGPQGGREAGVSAGHSTRQGAARQGTRQGARQGPGWPLHGSRERGPPPPLGRWAGAGAFPET